MNDSFTPHFLELPASSDSLLALIYDFLGNWTDQNDGRIGAAELAVAEEKLGVQFPPLLREFYLRFGSLLGKHEGTFDTNEDSLYTFDGCQVIGNSANNIESGILVFAGNYWGAEWGIRVQDLTKPDPRIVIAHSNVGEEDGIFSLAEFLVGMTFRATVYHAPVAYYIDLLSGNGEAEDQLRLKLVQEILDELLKHYSAWERGHEGESNCGFHAHIEGPEIIASDIESGLYLGLRSEAAIAELPGRLGSIINTLEPYRGKRYPG